MGLGLQFISPEFIEEGIEGPEMDLWALGCIIYNMVTGRKPFNAESNELIVQNILSKDLLWDMDDQTLSVECVDIIEKLMHLQPDLRLGAGKKDTPQDFTNLIEHKWFKDLNDIRE